MKATIVDLRYKMKDVLKALDNNEEVSILYHGKVKGTIIPSINSSEKLVSSHSFFAMNNEIEDSALDELENIRGGRYNAL